MGQGYLVASQRSSLKGINDFTAMNGQQADEVELLCHEQGSKGVTVWQVGRWACIPALGWRTRSESYLDTGTPRLESVISNVRHAFLKLFRR